MESTWEPRDLPVLEAIVRLTEQLGHSVTPAQISSDTGLDARDVTLAITALKGENTPLISTGPRTGAGHYTLVGGATGEARRRVGAWPTPENLAAKVADAILEAAATEQNPEKKTKLQALASVIKDTGREVFTDAIAKTISGTIPL